MLQLSAFDHYQRLNRPVVFAQYVSDQLLTDFCRLVIVVSGRHHMALYTTSVYPVSTSLRFGWRTPKLRRFSLGFVLKWSAKVMTKQWVAFLFQVNYLILHSTSMVDWLKSIPMSQVKDDNALCKKFSCSKRFY